MFYPYYCAATLDTVLSVHPLSVCHTFSQSQKKVKVSGIICIKQLCKTAV